MDHNAPEAPLDGRKQRSAASQRRIVAALVSLIGEGTLAPSAELVAERASVDLLGAGSDSLAAIDLLLSFEAWQRLPPIRAWTKPPPARC